MDPWRKEPWWSYGTTMAIKNPLRLSGKSLFSDLPKVTWNGVKLGLLLYFQPSTLYLYQVLSLSLKISVVLTVINFL